MQNINWFELLSAVLSSVVTYFVGHRVGSGKAAPPSRLTRTRVVPPDESSRTGGV